MMEKCLVCDGPATDVRSTQFAGEHPYCRTHAQLEPDWGEDDSTTFWREINPLVSVGDMMSDTGYEIGSLKECEESAARRSAAGVQPTTWTQEQVIKDIIRRSTAKIKLIRKHQKELQEIYDQCNHHGTVEQKSSYFGGSYYDRAYTRYWAQCTVCGQKSEEVIKEHSYYG